MATVGISGKSGRVQLGVGTTVGTSYLRVSKWRGNLRSQLVEISNTESPTATINGQTAVAEEWLSGLFGGDVEFEIVYVLADAPVLLLTPGGAGYTITLIPDKATATAKLTGTVMLETAELGTDIKGAVVLRCAGKFSGGFTATTV